MMPFIKEIKELQSSGFTGYGDRIEEGRDSLHKVFCKNVWHVTQ